MSDKSLRKDVQEILCMAKAPGFVMVQLNGRPNQSTRVMDMEHGSSSNVCAGDEH